MKIAEVMTKEPSCLDENASVVEAAEKMQQLECGILPVCASDNSEDVKGVITDRDIVTRAVIKDEKLSDIPVKEIMTSNLLICNEDDPLENAIEQMNQNNMRRILVYNDEEKLTGILSFGDVIRRVQDKSVLADLLGMTAVA